MQLTLILDPPKARKRTAHEYFAGQVLGMYTLLEHVQGGWLARCRCGVEKRVRPRNLLNGHIVSCGCFAAAQSRARRTHGHGTRKKTPTFQSWQHMRSRCLSPSSDCYHRYGGRGITVDPEWSVSFQAFLRDMGERPPGKTLDRRDGKLGYFKANCRWATPIEQAQNTSRRKLSPELATEIRALKGGAESGRKVALRYGVSNGRISAIWRGVAWVPTTESAEEGNHAVDA